MQFETLPTERLLLKILTPEGFNYLFENCSEAEIKSVLGLDSDEKFEQQKKKWQGGYVTYDRSILKFLMVLKENNETIGSCGYHNWYAMHRKAEIGYVLHKEEHKRKGYMTEAMKAVLHYGFCSMNLNRVEAFIGPDNAASQSLVKRYGFTQEGYLRQHFRYEDKVQDSLLFALLKEEYQNLKQ
jgi:ribosomal-protein-alanine N-acetyltransferase